MRVNMRRVGRLALVAAAGGAMLFGAAAASAAASGSAAAAPPNASAGVDSNLRITGLAGPNKLTISQVTGQNLFLVTDTAPIKALPGCAVVTVPNGLFGVQCRALTATNGAFKVVIVNSGAGDDVVTIDAPAALKADGGAGNDVLNGGVMGDLLSDSSGNDTLNGNGGQDDLNTEFEFGGGTKDVLNGGNDLDILKGGPGNDELRGGDGNDRLEGNGGADYLDAGPGSGDVVAYTYNNSRHVISLDNVANDGDANLTGGAFEGDNVMDTAEIVQGGSGPDTMFGNDKPNVFEGFDGDDVLSGGKGADDLRGGRGNDRLASNELFGVPVADGSIDNLDGFEGTDYCRVPFVTVEADITVGCETIDQD